MALTIDSIDKTLETLKSSKSKAKTAASSRAKAAGMVVDQIGSLDAAIAKINDKATPLLEQRGKLATGLNEYVDETRPAESKAIIEGQLFKAEFGAKANKTTISDLEVVKRLLEAIKTGLFMEAVTASITFLKKYLTPEQLEECTLTERTGARRSKIVPIK